MYLPIRSSKKKKRCISNNYIVLFHFLGLIYLFGKVTSPYHEENGFFLFAFLVIVESVNVLNNDLTFLRSGFLE